ncbi:anti-sigma factor family protein [Nisaea sediminum]|uniref:anti-sigma factor family protein n=1 Tax=Nisaea sediminum TaxID=2775867 RepID=UPI0018664657|nr:anti-sigma factor [Nisaea sediminum]
MPTNHDDDLPITTDDFHAYADDRLSPARAAAVEAYLSEHPDAARQVAEYRSLNETLREALDPALGEPATEIESGFLVPPRRPRFHVRFAAAAAIAGLLVGGASGWFANGYLGGPSSDAARIADRAATAYTVYAPEVRHPVEVSGTDADHLSAWLSNRMGMSFEIPRLETIGFTLVGGRLLMGEAAPAALLMYENGQGRRMVVYVRNDLAGARRTPMQYRRNAGAGVVYWVDGHKGFGLSGGFSEQELSGAARIVRALYES